MALAKLQVFQQGEGERSIWWSQALSWRVASLAVKPGYHRSKSWRRLTAVDDSDSHLKQQVCTLRRPTHLLRLRHALVDDLVDGGLHERGRDALTSSIPPAIVG